MVDAVAGDPQDPAAADQQRAAAALVARDFVVDEEFLEFLSAARAERRKPVAGTEVADGDRKLDRRLVQKGRQRACRSSGSTAASGSISRSARCESPVSRIVKHTAADHVVGNSRRRLRPAVRGRAGFAATSSDVVSLAPHPHVRRQVQRPRIAPASGQIQDLLDMGEGDAAAGHFLNDAQTRADDPALGRRRQARRSAPAPRVSRPGRRAMTACSRMG
ncbi:MAG: hypothetical protein MZV70_08940 [Desulfobacterales bacterium]|nr:hypothetical protein [Desulfobacterales bacterium]